MSAITSALTHNHWQSVSISRQFSPFSSTMLKNQQVGAQWAR